MGEDTIFREQETANIGMLNSMGSIEKFWSELTADEKIERLRKETKMQTQLNANLQDKLLKLEKKFQYHQHDAFERILIPHDINMDTHINNRGRITDKTGDEVYI